MGDLTLGKKNADHPGLTKVGVELTDSVYVVLSVRVMARMGTVAYEQLDQKGSVGAG